MDNKVFIIAEAGVNHNGDYDLALQLIDAAIEAGADAVKFQTFKAEKLVTKELSKAKYQQKAIATNESQFNMLKRLELSHEAYHDLFLYCKNKNIKFLSTAFDTDSLKFLVNDLGLQTLKIPSGEITNGALLLEHAQVGCDLILSTGMTTLAEIEDALAVVAFGLLHGVNSPALPSEQAFQQAYTSSKGQELLKQKVTLLHCTTEYPAPFEDINLNAMETMRKTFGLAVGYSDHSRGIAIPVAATALGAVLIEKHFTLNKNLSGPDHQASLEPHELKDMVEAIRHVELSIGNGVKTPMPSEVKNIAIARKSLVASQKIAKGELFTEENITAKRSGHGVSPMNIWSYLGTVSTQDYQVDELIS